jgi:hypothetical protein
MSTLDWFKIEPQELDIHELVKSQAHLNWDSLIQESDDSYSGDTFIHVIRFNGINYIVDGHHRVMKYKLKGKTTIKGRFLCKD